jgi:tRNA A-37 threonylcarbamoyl transferase component Bud32
MSDRDQHLDVPAQQQSPPGECQPTKLPSAAGAADSMATLIGHATSAHSRYERTCLLAEGGLGRLYVARDTVLNRCVALKEIKPAYLDDPEARRRFLLEAQVTGQLEHPNIVPIHELAIRPEDGSPYYTMRLVAGRTFRVAITDYHRRRKPGSIDRLEQTRLLTAFIEVCQAIAYAHSRGVVHRDLKPENILLGNFGEVVVLDWGLAKVVRMAPDSGMSPVSPTSDVNAEKTLAGEVLGTPAYMAPEQASGQVDLIDARTDVYALGAILYEILTGRKPHEGASIQEVLGKAATALAPSARLVEPSTPSSLDAICGRAMAREQNQRYASAAEMAQEVQRYLADEPVLACPENWSRRLARWMRHNRSWTLAAAAALILVALVTALAAVRLGSMAGSERKARLAADRFRMQNLHTTATFASRTLAAEIDLRWRILEAEAQSNQLREGLFALEKAGKALDPAARKPIQAWLNERYARHSAAVKATNWVLLDQNGTIVARSPANDKVIGRNFANRDFFHGESYDAPPGSHLPPLTHVHLSRVFKSQADSKLRVAFSVPVRASAAKDAKVIGVLAMSVELGRFSSLRLGLGARQVVVLVDTREDTVEGRSHKGLILHHPYLTKLSHEQAADKAKGTQVFRLDPFQVARLEKLREERLEHELALEKHPDNQAVIEDSLADTDNLDLDYQDPVGGAYAGTWVAVFEPVLVHGRSDAVMDTGWVVIVQERQKD